MLKWLASHGLAAQDSKRQRPTSGRSRDAHQVGLGVSMFPAKER